MVLRDCCFGSWVVKCDGRGALCPSGSKLGLSNARYGTVEPVIEALTARGWSVTIENGGKRILAKCPSCQKGG